MGRYRRRGRWAITAGGVAAEPRDAELALSNYLDVLREQRLRPLFVGVPDPRPFARRGLYTCPLAQEAAVIALRRFDLADPAMGVVRRAVGAAERAGLRILAADAEDPATECRVAVDATGRQLASVQWCRRGADDGVPLELVSWRCNDEDGPAGPTLIALIAAGLADYRARGVASISLGPGHRDWWPRGAPRADRALPGPVIEAFGPRWRTRWLAMLSGWQLPAAWHALH
ncbi:phosphatidylglycerol lysyltransferase domain-containing protein [Pseudonocardia acidicola]|uniref:DUF2156 domain-containing protein n=1 Tax=Pseudonocardia acidicola TaxID=2724939 RepID=A0ABX1SJB6_9PSEU|nr:DUF2156 domain-containing protein [Pseudonocardia acidicola]